MKFHHSNVTAQYPSLYQEGTRTPNFYIHSDGLSRSGINIIKSELFGNSTWNVVKYDYQRPTYSLRKRVDLERARELLRDCHENHGSICSLEALLELRVGKKDSRMSRFAQEFFSSLTLGTGGLDGRGKSPPNFRLIDVRRMCVVPAPSGPRGGLPGYVALSYVWGDATQRQLTRANFRAMTEPGALSRLVSIPKTVWEAIECIKELGEDFLWVDRLCIIQDDPFAKPATIKQMHRIYMNAMFTIVAAAGIDCQHGLAGFRTDWNPTIQSRALENVGPCTIRGIDLQLRESQDPHPLTSLWGSRWSTRGWTFQEKVCSPRALIFLDSYLIVWCPQSIYSSDCVGWRTLKGRDTFIRGISSLSVFRGSDDLKELGDTLQLMLSQYLSRQLGDQQDFLNAFSGILEFLQPTMGEPRHGIPLKIFSRGLAWSSGSTIGHGMLVKPSWSWVAWEFDSSAGCRTPPSGNILVVFAGDRPDAPISTPTKDVDVLSRSDWTAQFDKDNDDRKHVRRRLLEVIHSIDPASYLGSRSRLLTLLRRFEMDRKFAKRVKKSAELRKLYSESPDGIPDPEAYIDALVPIFDGELRHELSSFFIGFFTSMATLSVRLADMNCHNGNQVLWHVYPQGMADPETRLTSVLLPKQLDFWLGPQYVDRAAFDADFIVIQGRRKERNLINPGDIAKVYDIMMIHWPWEGCPVATRVQMADPPVEARLWHANPDSKGAARRKCIILG